MQQLTTSNTRMWTWTVFQRYFFSLGTISIIPSHIAARAMWMDFQTFCTNKFLAKLDKAGVSAASMDVLPHISWADYMFWSLQCRPRWIRRATARNIRRCHEPKRGREYRVANCKGKYRSCCFRFHSWTVLLIIHRMAKHCLGRISRRSSWFSLTRDLRMPHMVKALQHPSGPISKMFRALWFRRPRSERCSISVSRRKNYHLIWFCMLNNKAYRYSKSICLMRRACHSVKLWHMRDKVQIRQYDRSWAQAWVEEVSGGSGIRLIHMQARNFTKFVSEIFNKTLSYGELPRMLNSRSFRIFSSSAGGRVIKSR